MSSTDKVLSVEVTIKNMFKKFGRFTALNGVSLKIEKGEFFTVIGPSGCGKTTLLRTVSGFYNPDQGQIFFNDQDMTDVPPWERNIGFVFQNYALWPNMNVFDNIAYGLKIRKKTKGFIKDKVEWALRLVNLPGIEKKYPNELSGGMQQRVAIARAIVIDPSLLLLDEPLSNLDAKLRVSLRKQIREIQTNLSITAIYVTHDQEEALEISDRIAVMNIGNIQQVGTPEEVYIDPGNKFVADFLGETNFIDGTVDSTGLFTADKLELELQSDYKAQQRQKVLLVSRPENIIVVDNQSDAHLHGRIDKRYYLGNIKKYQISTGRGEVELISLQDIGQVGESVYLRFKDFRILEAEVE